MTRHPPDSRPRRFFRLLELLYPRAHRERYAQEMEACFLREREASGGGMRFWAVVVLDHVRAAAAVRRRQKRQRDGTVNALWEDVRHATRTLRRAPAFTAFATLTLALGIGATTAAFSVLDRVVLRPLPYPGGERMVVVGLTQEGSPEQAGWMSAPLLAALQRSPGPAEEVVGIGRSYSVLTGLGDPRRVYPAEVTDGFFRFFGAGAAVGRLFAEGDHAPGAPPVAVVGHGLWSSPFGRDPSVVGATFVLDGVRRTVVGVLPKDFVPPEPVTRGIDGDVWVPLPLAERAASESRPEIGGIRTVARLRQEAGSDEMEAHLTRMVEGVYGAHPSRSVTAPAHDLRRLTVGEIGSVLWRVLAAVALLLAIACVNVASLLLTRASERALDLRVRSALGAGRGRLVRHLLFESVFLALLGGAVGGGVALLVVDGFRRFSPGGVPRLAEVALDGRALAFSFAVALAAVAVFGLLPAFRAVAGSGAPGTRRSTFGRSDARLRGALVLAETALAVVLVVGSGLFVHDLVRRVQEDPGYRPEGLVTARVAVPSDRYEAEGLRISFWRELREGARSLPGVASVALTTELPTIGFGAGIELTPEGHDEAETISVVRAGTDFHATLGLRVVEGRWFSAEDPGSEPVAVVNQAFVDTYWPGVPSVVGRYLQRGYRATNWQFRDTYSLLGENAEWRVVGVAKDTRVQPGVGPEPKVYVPLPEAVSASMMELVVRVEGEGDAAALAPELRALALRLDPGLVDIDIRTVAMLNAQALARPRFYTILFSSFGLAAFLLALVGVYGTTAYAARARTREIGIRMALGARRVQVVREVVVRTLLVVAGGIAVGLAAAALGSRALTDVLLTIGPRDVLTYATMATLVLVAGAAAALIPAAQASRVDPASTLREEG